MSVCVHGNLCRDIHKKTGFIYSKRCPAGCPYFEEKYKQDNSSLKVKRVEIILTNSENYEPQERSCSNCKYWLLDKNDENRKCKYCFEMDEWIAKSEDDI